VDDVRTQGFTTVRSIAAQLNERGILTPRGAAWHPTSGRSVAVAFASVTTKRLSGSYAMSLLLLRVWEENTPVRYFKNVE
jgi:hypothetical protein